MFYVVKKGTAIFRKVYAVIGTEFMFWDEEDDCWVFGEIDDYRPLESVL